MRRPLHAATVGGDGLWQRGGAVFVCAPVRELQVTCPAGRAQGRWMDTRSITGVVLLGVVNKTRPLRRVFSDGVRL